MLEEGACVVLSDIDKNSLDKVVSELSKTYHKDL